MAARNEDHAFYDLEDNLFGDSVTDPDVRAAFKAKMTQVEEKRDINAMLLSLKDSLNDDLILALASLPVEEYRKAFKATSGDELRKMLSGVFKFDRIVNATPAMKEISSRARQALKIIGGESPINRRRVSRYGVNVDDAIAPAAAVSQLIERPRIFAASSGGRRRSIELRVSLLICLSR